MSLRRETPGKLGVALTWSAALGCALELVGACQHTVEVGVAEARGVAGTSLGGSLAGGSGGGGGVSAGSDGGGLAGAPPCQETLCLGKLYECGDCLDNDGDGLADADDADCLGPCDDDEGALSTGLLGPATTCRQDCYFDGDKGGGNDQCLWSHACDELSLEPDFPPSGQARCAYDPATTISNLDCAAMAAQQSPACIETCLPLVPNGCDCFGCCELPGRSGDFYFVGLGRGDSGCSLDRLGDAVACPPCTPVTSCFNACDECESCVGSLPDGSCDPGAACPPGQAACLTDDPCDFGEYCVTGCCVRAPKPT